MDYRAFTANLFLTFLLAVQVSRVIAASPYDPAAKDIGRDANERASDFRAIFPIKVSLKSKPDTASTYERTTISVETNPQFSIEVVEVRDETRGIVSRYSGNDMNLRSLFGPRTGITDHITVSAIVRLGNQTGEAVVRRTILIRNVQPELWHKAELQGSVRVNVMLDVDAKPEGSLTDGAIAAQRQSISDSQDRLIEVLAGTDFKIVRRFEMIPGFVLDVGPKSLAILDRLPQVLTVTEVYFDRIRGVPQ